jgi:hypothetical protein
MFARNGDWEIGGVYRSEVERDSSPYDKRLATPLNIPGYVHKQP